MKEHYDFSKGQRGAVASSNGKTRITIYLDSDIIEAFRAKAEVNGSGYQTEINQALRQVLDTQSGQPVTLEAIRAVVHEELKAAAALQGKISNLIP